MFTFSRFQTLMDDLTKHSQHLEKRRYAALERWTEALEGVHSTVVNKVSGGRAGDGSMMGMPPEAFSILG